jgi:hypothetical protein
MDYVLDSARTDLVCHIIICYKDKYVMIMKILYINRNILIIK